MSSISKEKTIKEEIVLLEENIDNYCGDYGTLENRIEETFNKILDILKAINDKLEV